MFISVHNTPNGDALKFLLNDVIKNNSGLVYFDDINVAERYSPLAHNIFSIGGVKGVFFGENFITVTKHTDTSWDEIRSIILAEISDHLAKGADIFISNDSNFFEHKCDSDIVGVDNLNIVNQIKEIIEERVRPSVAMDGGDIVFREFKNGVVYLELRGACDGCPSATITLKDGIERMLKHFVPEVREVRSI